MPICDEKEHYAVFEFALLSRKALAGSPSASLVPLQIHLAVAPVGNCNLLTADEVVLFAAVHETVLDSSAMQLQWSIVLWLTFT